NHAALIQVDEVQLEMARFLRRDIREFAVGADRDGMRFGHRDRINYGLGRGIDKGKTILAVDRDEQQFVVGCERYSVRRLADVDRLHHFVCGRIDDVKRRRTIAGYIDSVAVLRYRHAVRTRGYRHRRDDLASTGIDDAHGIVFEIAYIGLGRLSGSGRL